MKDIAFTARAAKQRAKLGAAIRARIDAKLDRFARTGQGDLKRLTGRDGTRLRIGDWRVIFYEEGNTIDVVPIGHRSEIYD